MSGEADHRDVVIEILALSEAELLERLVALEADIGIYRELAIVAFDTLRDLTVQNRRLGDERDRLRNENRALREQHLLTAGADDAAAA